MWVRRKFKDTSIYGILDVYTYISFDCHKICTRNAIRRWRIWEQNLYWETFCFCKTHRPEAYARKNALTHAHLERAHLDSEPLVNVRNVWCFFDFVVVVVFLLLFSVKNACRALRLGLVFLLICWRCGSPHHHWEIKESIQTDSV